MPADPKLGDYLQSATGPALATMRDPQFAQWHRHDNTWFVGVNALPNGADGAVAGGPPLEGTAIRIARDLYGPIPLDQAQVSVISPGYPRQDPDESDAAHGFRLRRDAAHVDGLKAVGADRRRFVDEVHAFILGLPLSDCAHAPLVVWEGSHEVVRTGFREFFGEPAQADWQAQDVTDCYSALRRKIFEDCRRIELPARRGEATLVHRLALHGVAPWGEGGSGETRAILYFRPNLPGGVGDWLGLP